MQGVVLVLGHSGCVQWVNIWRGYKHLRHREKDTRMFPGGGFGGGRAGWKGQRELVCPPLPTSLSAQISSAFQAHLHEILFFLNLIN